MLMLRLRNLALTAVALCTLSAAAQLPADGHVVGNAYVNRYFHVSYSWPAMLKPYNLPATATAGGNSGQYEFLLFSARQGDQSNGLIMVAEKLNVSTPHSSGVKTSAEYIDRLAQSIHPGPMLTNISRSEKKGPQGRAFSELDYTINGRPSATIATQIGQYALVFRCNAKSMGDLAQMRDSVLRLRTLK